MADFNQTVLASGLCLVRNTVIVQEHLITVVPARVDAESNGVHLVMRVQLTNILLNLTHGDNGAFPDVNGAVVSDRVIPRSVKIELHPTLDRILERTSVVCEIIPLAPSGEVDGTVCLTYKSVKRQPQVRREFFCISISYAASSIYVQ